MLTTVSSSMPMTATLYKPHDTESFTTCHQVNVDSSLMKPLEMKI